MRSGLRPLFYLLTLAAIITGSIGCSPAKTISSPTQSSAPVNLTITLDDSASVSALVPQKGGRISATLANGLVYTLDIPEGALLSDQEVTLTPIRSIDGLPFSGGLIGGVQLEPDGTVLAAPATLTIQVPQGYDERHLVGFGYHGQGTGLHLSPASGDGSTISLQIMSFSGHGAASGTDQDVTNQAGRPTASSTDDYQQQAAQILDQAKARGGQISDSDMKKLTGIWKDYYDQVVKPALKAAVSDDSKIDSAMSVFLNWWRQAELLGLEGDLSSRINEETSLLYKGLKNAFNKASQRCVSNQDISESANMIKRLRQLALLGDSDSNYTLDGKYSDFERCLRYKVAFDSIVTATTEANHNIISHVAGTVTLKLDKENAALFNIFRGSGDLNFKEYKSEWIGESEQMNQLCKVTNLTTKDGKLEIISRIDWIDLNSPSPKANLVLAVKPSGLSQGFPNLTCDTGGGWIKTNLNLDLPMWSAGFDQLHSDIKGSYDNLSDAYLFGGFEPGGKKLVGRLAQSKTKTLSDGKLAEDLTIDVTAAPGAE